MRQAGWGLAFLIIAGLAGLAPMLQRWTPASAQASTALGGAVRSFGAASTADAWVVSDGRLLITRDGGASWREATPPAMALTGALAVVFRDPLTGWVAEVAPQTPGAVRVAATTDGGRTWQVRVHALFAVNDPAGQASALAMHWLDRNTGWLVVRQATSSNFNQGTLFGTQDGGASWQRLALPGGEPVYFISATTGWTAGGPHGDAWFRSDDGGRTWAVVALPYPDVVGRGQRRHYPPYFTADRLHGVVVVTTSTPAGQRMDWYVTDDGGASWASASASPASADAAANVARLDAAAWLMAITGQPLQQPTLAAPFFANPTLAAPAVTLANLAMSTPDDGWATDARGVTLLRTQDGGQSWQVQLVNAATVTTPAPTRIRPGRGTAAGDARVDRTARLAAPGFDKCNIASEEELRRWSQDSPYRAVNLYIGGALRACDNAALDARLLAALTAQGWTFIPTWVGPQAPCTGYSQQFDLDPATAFAQGRSEAEKALVVASQLALADANGAGAVIYYDLEAYDGQDAACVEAARAFVAGWTQRLQESSSYAGLYALACNPPIARYADAAPAPDAVWFAAWTRNEFDPAMTVWNLASTCLPPTLWSQQQRIRQYTGSHDETWGGVTLEIDSNVLDGIVADLSGVTPPPPLTVVLEAPELSPAFDEGTACVDGWRRLTNVRGEAAYLAYSQPLGATIPPLNYGIWRPTLPITGTYRVEALIPSHGAIAWPCRDQTISPDTSRARYTIYHRNGATTTEQDQLPRNNEWLTLGSYPFAAGDSGFVYLDAAVEDAPKNVAFSAM
ncbi:MAG TPA: hypothetical protein DCL15_06010, partial [Chloroflexi bacterium]|nr:hypothetical protein [Chloroflexota bacterium]